jgi:uncharacterized protein (DUF952 family)
MIAPIIHVTYRTHWLAAKNSGSYTADSLAVEGFIHCSAHDQLLRVADAFFAGQPGLVLLVIDPRRLESEVRWEPGTDRPEELFPHVYGPINLESVVAVHDFEPGADGRFVLPSALAKIAGLDCQIQARNELD